jgi:hypothetical protein
LCEDAYKRLRKVSFGCVALSLTNWTDDDALRLSIEMALSKIKTKPRGADRDAIYRKMVAEQIVAHLKRSNWRFAQGPPLPPHG